jgi:hypothetical protein
MRASSAAPIACASTLVLQPVEHSRTGTVLHLVISDCSAAPLLVELREARRLLSVGKTKLNDLLNAGEVNGFVTERCLSRWSRSWFASSA